MGNEGFHQGFRMALPVTIPLGEGQGGPVGPGAATGSVTRVTSALLVIQVQRLSCRRPGRRMKTRSRISSHMIFVWQDFYDGRSNQESCGTYHSRDLPLTEDIPYQD